MTTSALQTGTTTSSDHRGGVLRFTHLADLLGVSTGESRSVSTPLDVDLFECLSVMPGAPRTFPRFSSLQRRLEYAEAGTVTTPTELILSFSNSATIAFARVANPPRPLSAHTVAIREAFLDVDDAPRDVVAQLDALAHLPEGWDGSLAPRIDSTVIDRSLRALRAAYNAAAQHGVELPKPLIGPLQHGAVQMEWESATQFLAIEVSLYGLTLVAEGRHVAAVDEATLADVKSAVVCGFRG